MVQWPVWLPSMWTLAGLCFLAYNTTSIVNLYHLYHPPECEPTSKAQPCLRPALVHQQTGEYPLFQVGSVANSLRVRLSSQRTTSSQVTVLIEDDFSLAQPFEKQIDWQLPPATRANGTLYVTVGLYRNGADTDDRPLVADEFVPAFVHKQREAQAFDLMGDRQSASDNKPELPVGSGNQSITHVYSVLPIVAVAHAFSFFRNQVPPDLISLFRLDNQQRYLPLLCVDQLSYRIKDLTPVESWTESVNVTLSYNPISVGTLSMHRMYERTADTLYQLGFSEKDWDEVKGIFVDTNYYLLALTLFVTTLHLIFDVLAFKNDISFWRARKDMVGVSSRTLLWRCFSNTIITVYLFDKDTSLLVLVPAGIGTLIEYWKLVRAYKMSISLRRLTISFGARSAAEQATDSFDSTGMAYLGYVMAPLCLGGAVYSLLYVPHKSWLSWLIESLANGVYAFGFLFMLPQLFVNYSLKSVAHLPWRAFTYKAFNTFIDDLFAFIITMPTAHRVACFRDDIVFVIYLYQRWLYPVDKSRVNEFGQAFDEDDDQHTKKQQ